jgi:hypothetical protein
MGIGQIITELTKTGKDDSKVNKNILVGVSIVALSNVMNSNSHQCL